MKAPARTYGYHHASFGKYVRIIGFAQEHRRAPTPAEEYLWKHLKGKRLGGYKFRRQHIIGSAIADNVCLQCRLIVEVDGAIHDEGEHPVLDEERTRRLEALGFQVIRFPNDEVLHQIDAVLARILTCLQERASTTPK